MIKLSIIIPVFNIEAYLSKCIESIVHQDIPSTEYEIIIIDDESTDRSLDIAQHFSSLYNNIKVISQKNLGLGGARNTGLIHAVGEFVMFVDSDDYLNSNSLFTLLDKMQRDKLELLRFNYRLVDESGVETSRTNNSLYSIVYDNEIVTGLKFIAQKLGWACYAWQFVINRSFLVNNNLFFNQHIYFEDVEWLVRVLIKAERVASINNVVYNYLQRQGSITRSVDIRKQEKIYKDKLYLLDFLDNVMVNNNAKPLKKWCKGMQGLLLIGLFPFVKCYFPSKKKEFLLIIKVKKYRPIIPFRYTKKQLRDAILVNLFPSLFYKLKG